MSILDDLVNACATKEPTKIASAFNDLMLGKTYARVQAEKASIAQTMFNPPVTEPKEAE